MKCPGQLPRTAAGSAGAVEQPARPLRMVAPQRLLDRSKRDTHGLGDVHFSTLGRETSTLMHRCSLPLVRKLRPSNISFPFPVGGKTF